MNDVPMLDTLGECRIDGLPVRHRRAAELAAVLLLSGGAAPRDWLAMVLFEGDPSPSSLPTLAMRARRIGLDVRYERETGVYRIGEGVRCDVVEFLFLLSHGYVAQAMEFYRGPFMVRSQSPFAVQTRAHLEQRIVEAVVGSGDVRLMADTLRVVRDPRRRRALVRDAEAALV